MKYLFYYIPAVSMRHEQLNPNDILYLLIQLTCFYSRHHLKDFSIVFQMVSQIKFSIIPFACLNV